MQRKRVTNSDILFHQQWYSSTFGFVDLSQANDGYVRAVYEYWFYIRRPSMIQKINKKKQREKNKRRKEVVQLYDSIVTREYVKRNLI